MSVSSVGGLAVEPRHACGSCLRRAWLLATLSQALDRHRHDAERLASLLARPDEELLASLAGADLEALTASHANFKVEATPRGSSFWPICRHDPGFPDALREVTGAPHLLYGTCGDRYLEYLLKAPAVAIVGSRDPSDYGREVARNLGRELASATLTVLSGLADGIAASAHAGALEVGGPTLTVMPGGLDVCYPAARRELYGRLRSEGGVLSELPPGARVRRWCHPARARIVAGLAQLVIVVEACESPGELVHARMARANGRLVAAVPGRVGSRLSRGPHALLRAGAPLVQDAQDVLDLLHGVGTRRVAWRARPLGRAHREVFERVAGGEDTLAKLGARTPLDEALLVGLAELELMGALRRGDGGRYVPSGDFRAG